MLSQKKRMIAEKVGRVFRIGGRLMRGRDRRNDKKGWRGGTLIIP
jgi:hypothetical protein